MADALSVAANVLAVIQITTDAIRLLNEIKDAPKDRERCRTALWNNYNLLLSLRFRLEAGQNRGDAWYAAVIALAAENGPLVQYKLALEELMPKVSGKSGLTKFGNAFLWKFSKDDVESILSRLERLKSHVLVALELDAFKLTETIHDDLLRDRILQWISPSDFPSEHSDLISQRQEGTGLWFLVSQEFDKWRDERKQTLFCCGMPGAGKTMLAAMTIDHLSKTIRSRSAGLAYVFCNYKTQTSQSAASLLAAILKQLVQDQPTIPDRVWNIYREHYPRGTNMSFDDCVEALTSVCRMYPTVYIVVDALDECSGRNDETRSRLLTAIFDLQRSLDVRLMVTSRPIPDIVDIFHDFPTIEIRATPEDVEQFVTDQMSRLPRCVRDNEDLKALVQKKVVEAADGMLVAMIGVHHPLTNRRFQLARLYLDSLQDTTTIKQVKNVLARTFESTRGKNVEQVYDQAYGEALLRIEAQSPMKSALARRTLSWITAARRPLSVSELCTFLALEPDEDDLENIEDVDYENVPAIEDIMSVCAGLLVVDTEADIARLVHHTAQEYFQRKLKLWAPNAQKDITLCCLMHLISLSEAGDLLEAEFRSSISDYAVQNWGSHAQSCELDPVVTRLAFRFLKLDYVPYPFPAAVLDGNREPDIIFGSGIHLLSVYGLHVWLSKLLDTRESWTATINQLDMERHTALAWAAALGNVDVVRVLLRRPELVVNTICGNRGTALTVACSYRRVSVAEMLLEQDGVDVNVEDDQGRSVLWYAAEFGSKAMISALLQRKVKHTPVLWRGIPIFSSPMIRAVMGGHEEVVRLLFNNHREAYARDEIGSIAIECALLANQEKIAQFLIANGCKPQETTATRFSQSTSGRSASE